MLKDFYEDKKRIQADGQENKSLVLVMNTATGEFKPQQWRRLRVGNVVKILKDSYIPSDIVVIQSSDPKGDVFIETKNLDGETNLKMKKAQPQFLATYNPTNSTNKLIDQPFKVSYGKPIPFFNKFQGTIYFQIDENGVTKEVEQKLNLSNLILRGSKMKNTNWVIGMVCYTGHDTKIMQNTFRPKTKNSQVEISMGKYIIVIFGIQNFLCMICSIWYQVWNAQNQGKLQYIDTENNHSKGIQYVVDFIVYYFTWMLIFTNFVPISLLVTLEFVKFLQGFLMQSDRDMGQCTVQTSNLNEELGQIKYIFSDKTGTLTCNNMDFKKLAIGTTVYGDVELDDIERYIDDEDLMKYPQVSNVDFRDRLLLNILDDKNHELHNKVLQTLIAISVCHTVVAFVEEKDGQDIVSYSATSPDEIALVNFAKFCGVQFYGIDDDDILKVKFKGEVYKYQKLQLFEFNSLRKKQSIIIQDLKFDNQEFQYHNTSKYSSLNVFQSKTVSKQGSLSYQMAPVQTTEENSILLHPTIQKRQGFQITFKINKMGSKKGIAFGVGNKQIIANSHYTFSNKSVGHGYYVISANGIQYSHHDEKINNKPIPNFKISQDDLITITLNPQKMVLEYEIIGEKTQKFSLKLNNFSDFQFYPVVLIQDLEDSVTIISGKIQKNQIQLICKGADSVIFKGSKDTDNKIEKLFTILTNFGRIGLRTLLISQKAIDPDYYEKWEKQFKQVENEHHNIEKQNKRDALQNELEQKLTILSATAIEDKLQDDVPETIRALRDAGIKLWVLTGDKVETAINIAFSCKLLDLGMQRFQITAEEEGLLMASLQDVLSEIENANPSGNPDLDNYAFIISGEALNFLNIPEIEYMIYQIGQKCKVVLCCRVSPKQKEQIVTAVRKMEPLSPTLAIGDGANDVNMLTAAHVGIGIKGVEGQQAARASDYVLQQFKYLRKLLFYHGRECYRRNSQLVIYNFYKNILLVLPQFWYGFAGHFSGQTLYDSYLYQLFNMFFSSFPIMIYAIFDEQVKNGQKIMTENKFRNYYKQGLENKCFKPSVFWKQYIIAMIQAGIILMISVYSLESNFVYAQGEGYNSHFWQTGTMVFSLVVIVVNFKIWTISYTFSIGYWIFIWISLLSYLASWYFFSYLSPQHDIFDTFQSMNLVAYYHMGNFLGIVATSLIDYFIELYSRWQYEYDQMIKHQVKRLHMNQQKIGPPRKSVNQKTNKNQVIKVRINQQSNNFGFNFSYLEQNNHYDQQEGQ